MIKSLEIKRLWISIQSTTGEGIFCSLLSQKGLYGTVSNSLAHNKVIFSQISPHTNFQILQKHWIPWEKNPYKWIENECRLQQVKKQMCIQTQGKLPHEDKNQAWKWFYAKSCTFKTDAGNQCHQIKFKHRPWHQTSKKKRQQNSSVEKKHLISAPEVPQIIKYVWAIHMQTLVNDDGQLILQDLPSYSKNFP